MILQIETAMSHIVIMFDNKASKSFLEESLFYYSPSGSILRYSKKYYLRPFFL